MFKRIVKEEALEFGIISGLVKLIHFFEMTLTNIA